MLSFADIEGLFKIMYEHNKVFVVHMNGQDLVFERREQLYVADWSTTGMVGATVQENEQLCKAKLMHKFVKNCG